MVFEHDVLIIGAGLAGLRAGIEAKRKGVDVAILTKVYPVRSHTNAAQGGINASLDEGDSWESHAYDTVKGSDYLGDQDAIEILAQEAPSDIIELEHMGVIFNRDDEGRLGTRAFGGASHARTYFVADITGVSRADLVGVDEHDVVALLHHRANPGFTNIAQHERPERAVVVAAAESAVDLGRGVHEATTLREVDDLVEFCGSHSPTRLRPATRDAK